MANIETKVEELLQTPIQELGYELYDVEYVKEGKNNFLRIYIDKESGIDLNDCERVNNAISDLLDEKDYIKDTYFLEISSPGIERVLKKDKHLKDNINKKVEVSLYKPIKKQKQIQGILKSFDKDNINIETNQEKMEISRKDISQIKTVYEWE